MSDKKSAETFYNTGIMHYEKGQYDLSLANFKKAINKNPSNYLFYYNIGLVYLKKEEIDLAIKNFLESVSLNPKDSDSYYNLGISYFKKGEIKKAINAYQKSIEIAPNDFASYDNLGIAYFTINDYDNAIINFKKSLEFKPDNSSAAYNLAYSYYLSKQYDLAKDAFIKSISITEDDEEAHFNLGNTCLILKEYESALESFNKVLSINPGHEGAKNAIEELNKISIEEVPEVPLKEPEPESDSRSESEIAAEKHFQAAVNHLKNKELDLAVEEFRETLIIQRDHPQALEALKNTEKLINEANQLLTTGISLYQNKEYSQAIEYLNKALLIKPHDSKIKGLLDVALNENKTAYLSYIENGLYDTAIDSLKHAIAANPNDPDNHYNLGSVYIKQNEYDQAIDSLKNALAVNPDHKKAKEALCEVIKTINTYQDKSKDYFKLSLIHIQKQEYTSAITALGKVLEVDPENSEAKALTIKVMELMNLKGEVATTKQDLDEESKKLKKQIQDNPDDYEAYYKLGIIYQKKLEYDLALASMQKVLELKSDHKEAQEAIFTLMRMKNTY